ncbi:hypothetical protein PA08_1508 [Cutibacterium modestum P08]|nr:hypothetical protein PA08_1508 [Cutibacterium modestum P08]
MIEFDPSAQAAAGGDEVTKKRTVTTAQVENPGVRRHQ